jgi:hypothetical protein
MLYDCKSCYHCEIEGCYLHPGVAGRGAVDIGLVDDEEDLMQKIR